MTSSFDQEAHFAALRRIFGRTPALELVKQTLEALAPGHARIALVPSERHYNGAACIHGGIIATVLDTAGWFACATDPERQWLMTVQLNVNFMDSVGDEKLLVSGDVLRKGGQLFHARMDAVTERGRSIATALATYAILPRLLRG